MTKGEGLVALLYALKGIIVAGATWVITGFAVLSFFLLIIKYIGDKMGIFNTSGGPFGGGGSKVKAKNILWAIFLLFVIFAVYSLIALTADIFGVNSSPSGGIYISR